MNFKQKNNIAILLLILAIGAVIIFGIIKSLRDKVEPDSLSEVTIINQLEPNPALTGQSTEIVQISKSVDLASIPESLPVYSYTKNSELIQQNANGIVQRYNLTINAEVETPTQGKVMAASQNTFSMTAEIDRGVITFTDSNIGQEVFSADIDINRYESSAREFLTNTGINNSHYVLEEVAYKSNYNSPQPVVVENYGQANIIELTFKSKINNYALIDKNGSLSANTIIVWLDPSFVVKKFYYEYTGSIGRKSRQVSLKTEGEILQDLNNNKAKLINTDLTTGNDITYTIARNAEIAYLAVNNELVPVLKIEGETHTTGSEIAKGDLIMNVIKE